MTRGLLDFALHWLRSAREDAGCAPPVATARGPAGAVCELTIRGRFEQLRERPIEAQLSEVIDR